MVRATQGRRRTVWGDALKVLTKRIECTHQRPLFRYGTAVAVFFPVLRTRRESDLGWGLAAPVFPRCPSRGIHQLAAFRVPCHQQWHTVLCFLAALPAVCQCGSALFCVGI